MAERNSSKSSEQKAAKSPFSAAAPFFVGVVAALVVGWWVFPQALYSEKLQPVQFSHTAHAEGAGMACSDCHNFREDGSYNGLPTTEDCAQCHAEPVTDKPSEKQFIEEYVATGKEVNWLVYQMQPDNVFFSHAAHSLEKCGECHADWDEKQLCANCHPNVADTNTPPVYFENRISTYSKDTMKMWACEKCHVVPDHRDNTNANNACFTCHK